MALPGRSTTLLQVRARYRTATLSSAAAAAYVTAGALMPSRVCSPRPRAGRAGAPAFGRSGPGRCAVAPCAR